MQNQKLTEDEVQKFMQGCEDLMRLGNKFTMNIRQAVTDLKGTYDPVLKSQYVEKAVVELLTRSLQDFERKVESSLEGIDKVCTKGGKWFSFYLGRAMEKELSSQLDLPSRPTESKMAEGNEHGHRPLAKKAGS